MMILVIIQTILSSPYLNSFNIFDLMGLSSEFYDSLDFSSRSNGLVSSMESMSNPTESDILCTSS